MGALYKLKGGRSPKKTLIEYKKLQRLSTCQPGTRLLEWVSWSSWPLSSFSLQAPVYPIKWSAFELGEDHALKPMQTHAKRIL